MVDPDRRPDPRSLWTRILDGVFARRSRVDSATDASHDIAAATTANYLSEPDAEYDDTPLWRLEPRLWAQLRVTAAARWAFRCPECHTRPDRQRWSRAPRWADDRVAQMLGIVAGRCPRCGHAEDHSQEETT